MCGSVRHENRAKHIGNIVVVTKENKSVHIGKWMGFARFENLQSIWLNKYYPSLLNADSFNEHGVEFNVPKGYGIFTAVLKSIVGKYKPNDVLIVTRPAITEAEKLVHHRFPMFRELF